MTSIQQHADEALRVRATFEKFDKNNDGKLCRGELKGALAGAGVPASDAAVSELLTLMDTSKDGVVTFDEFQTFYAERVRQLRSTFDQLDTRGKGHLTAADLRMALTQLKMTASDEEIRDLLRRADTDNSGDISFEEFRRFLLLLPGRNPKAMFDAWRYIAVSDDAQGEYSKPPDRHPTDTGHKVFTKLWCGAVAGTVSRSIVAPVDRLKVVMQAAKPGSTLSVANTLRQIYAEGGVRAFYMGNFTNCVKIAPEVGVKFLTFDYAKRMIAHDPDNITIPERLAAGGLAGATAQFVVYPLEIAKTRLSLAPRGTYKHFVDCINQVVRKEGVKALFSGLGASVIGIIPYAGVELSVNSLLRERVSAYYEARDKEPGVLTLLGCGMASSTVGMLCTYPLGLVRTRLQARGLPDAVHYTGALDVVRKTVTSEGFFGLYRGLLPNMLKVLPSTSVSFYVYGELQRRFANPEKNKATA